MKKIKILTLVLIIGSINFACFHPFHRHSAYSYKAVQQKRQVLEKKEEARRRKEEERRKKLEAKKAALAKKEQKREEALERREKLRKEKLVRKEMLLAEKKRRREEALRRKEEKHKAKAQKRAEALAKKKAALEKKRAEKEEVLKKRQALIAKKREKYEDKIKVRRLLKDMGYMYVHAMGEELFVFFDSDFYDLKRFKEAVGEKLKNFPLSRLALTPGRFYLDGDTISVDVRWKKVYKGRRKTVSGRAKFVFKKYLEGIRLLKIEGDNPF